MSSWKRRITGALCTHRMCARKLGYRGERVMLPVCVQVWIDKNFTDEGEQQTGFIPSGEAN